MPEFSLERRLLSLTTPLGADVLLPESFSGREGISRLFEYDVEVLAKVDTKVTAEALIGRKVTLSLEAREDGYSRYFSGMVASFQERGGEEEFKVYGLRIVPALWLLTLNENTRVFQNKSVIEVIKAVLGAYGISPKDNTQKKDSRHEKIYTALDYCTQYRETDFDFISRLMERWGIFYSFTHTENDHTLVLEDTSALLPDCPVQHEFRYAPEFGAADSVYDYVIRQFTSISTLVPGKHVVWDYRFSQYKVDLPSAALTAGPLGHNEHEIYDYLGSADANYKLHASGEVTLRAQESEESLRDVRRDVADAATMVANGVSNARVLGPARTFTLTQHPTLNRKYLVTLVEHKARQSPSYRTRDKDQGPAYANEFRAMPSSIAFRAPQTTRRPTVQGVHTAKVVAPKGEDSYLDKFGRVCVQFFWDRERKSETVDNTLLRVAQPWAGKGWGTFFWPRVGDEVIVDFIEGDPDQPIVVGSVYNGENTPKYALPDNFTRSGIVTRSSKGSASTNANELRFEDKKNSEQIFINAEKDMDLRVEKDARTYVGGEQHLIVKDKQLESIGADKQESIKGNHVEKVAQQADRSVGQNFNEKIGMDYSLNVGKNHYSKAGMVYVVDSGEEVHIKGGVNVVIEGGMGLCLSGPGGFISIDPSGVTIQGLLVKINSGGAQLQGSPAQTQSPGEPKAPDEADNGTDGPKKSS